MNPGPTRVDPYCPSDQFPNPPTRLGFSELTPELSNNRDI